MANNINPDVNTAKGNVTKDQKLTQAVDGDVSARPEGLELENPAPTDYGQMNVQDAKESGYTDEEGNAVSKAKEDVKGSPTGAYTDVGAGRSSAVTKH